MSGLLVLRSGGFWVWGLLLRSFGLRWWFVWGWREFRILASGGGIGGWVRSITAILDYVGLSKGWLDCEGFRISGVGYVGCGRFDVFIALGFRGLSLSDLHVSSRRIFGVNGACSIEHGESVRFGLWG